MSGNGVMTQQREILKRKNYMYIQQLILGKNIEKSEEDLGKMVKIHVHSFLGIIMILFMEKVLLDLEL